MAEVTVAQLAGEIGTPVDKLVEQLADAGIKKSVTDSVSEQEKENLLSFLKKQHVDYASASPSRRMMYRKKKST